MGLRFYIRSHDGVVTEYDAGRFRFADLSVTQNAEEASVGTSSLFIHDPTGDLDITGHRVFGIKEDAVAAASNQFVYVGYTAERKVKRGESELTGASRVWEVTLTDVNTVVERRIMLGNDAKRPAETDVARMNWLLGTNEASRIDSTLYVSQENGVAMDAVDYRGQSFGQVVNDCCQASGKNFYVSYWGETISAEDPWGYFGAWYDHSGSELYVSMLRLSNFLDDIDSPSGGNTFAISADTTLTRDPSRVYSGVYLPWDGGNTYVQRTATYNTFAQRDVAMYAQNIKSAAQATARANRYLDDLDTEEDVISTSIIVPDTKVNHLREGMLVQFKATHLPGYETFTWLRVLNRTVQQLSDDTSNEYRILLELSAGDSVTTVPPAEGSAARLVLYQPKNTDTGSRSNIIHFESSGDDPGSGYASDPTVGLLSKTEVLGFWTQVDVGGTGTLDITFTCSCAEVFAAGSRIATFSILLNGAIVGSGSATTVLSSGSYWSPSATATVSGLAVVPGDIIKFSYSGDLSLSGQFPLVPAGSGSFANRVVITGTLA